MRTYACLKEGEKCYAFGKFYVYEKRMFPIHFAQDSGFDANTSKLTLQF